MVPVLFHLGRWPMPSHPFFIGLGILAAIIVFTFEARWIVRCRGRARDLFAPVVTMAIGRVGSVLNEQPGSPTLLPWLRSVRLP